MLAWSKVNPALGTDLQMLFRSDPKWVGEGGGVLILRVTKN